MDWQKYTGVRINHVLKRSAEEMTRDQEQRHLVTMLSKEHVEELKRELKRRERAKHPIRFIEAGKSVSAEEYEKHRRLVDEQIRLAVLGQTLTEAEESTKRTMEPMWSEQVKSPVVEMASAATQILPNLPRYSFIHLPRMEVGQRVRQFNDDSPHRDGIIETIMEYEDGHLGSFMVRYDDGKVPTRVAPHRFSTPPHPFLTHHARDNWLRWIFPLDPKILPVVGMGIIHRNPKGKILGGQIREVLDCGELIVNIDCDPNVGPLQLWTNLDLWYETTWPAKLWRRPWESDGRR